jgi:hypothetical protein
MGQAGGKGSEKFWILGLDFGLKRLSDSDLDAIHNPKSKIVRSYFNSLFFARNAATASLNSLGFSIIRKWVTPVHT